MLFGANQIIIEAKYSILKLLCRTLFFQIEAKYPVFQIKIQLHYIKIFAKGTILECKNVVDI